MAKDNETNKKFKSAGILQYRYFKIIDTFLNNKHNDLASGCPRQGWCDTVDIHIGIAGAGSCCGHRKILPTWTEAAQDIEL